MKNVMRMLVLATVFLPTLGALEDEGARRDQLRRLRGAISAYGMLNPGKMPAKLSELVDESLVDGPAALLRPGKAATVPPRAKLDARSDYTLEPISGVADIVVREKTPLPGEKEVFVILKDGTIKAVAAPADASRPIPPPAERVEVGKEVPAPRVTRPEVTTEPLLPTVPTPSVGTPPPTTVATNNAKANALLLTGRVAEARALFAAATEARPNSAEGFIGLGKCANLLGEIDAAIAAYETALRLAPDTANLRTWLAELCLAKDDVAAAQRWIDEEIRAQPNSAWAWSWLASVQMHTGKRTDSRRSLAHAAELQQQASHFRYQNGATLLAHNQPGRAAPEFIMALLLEPEGIGAYFQLGDCYQRLGRKELAAEYFRRYLQSDATSDWAAQARQRLQQLGGPP